MNNSIPVPMNMTYPASLPMSKRRSARAALVDMKESSRLIFAECFRQFGIETVSISSAVSDRLKSEKFEACVVRLGGEAAPVMETARTSPSNNRMVIYGVGGTVQDAMKFSKYGVNAVFNEPLERTSVLKLVRSTQMLVLHEFRRYVRIPVITEVSLLLSDNRKIEVTSQEVSSGGMSFKSTDMIPVGQPLEASFGLLNLPRIWVKGSVTWRNANAKTFGIRFDMQDERRTKVKQWIESYLEN
jgi:hypothetical protein